jgi:hypothetical protein
MIESLPAPQESDEALVAGVASKEEAAGLLMAFRRELQTLMNGRHESAQLSDPETTDELEAEIKRVGNLVEVLEEKMRALPE